MRLICAIVLITASVFADQVFIDVGRVQDLSYVEESPGVFVSRFTASAPAPEFYPTNLTGCALWLDYSDANTLYDAISGGSLVAADGAIGRCEDKSGGTYHAYTIESGQRPLRKDASLNGKRSALFDSDDYSNWNSPTTSNACTVFIVHKYAGTTLYVPFNAGSSHYFYVAYQGSSDTTIASGAGTQSYRLNGSTASWANRGDVYTALENVAAVVTVEGFDASSWTGLWYLHGYSGARPTGYVGEIIVYNRALNATERSQVETYLKSKWGI